MEKTQRARVKNETHMTGRLILIGTPIGNLGDMSPRALETLGSLDALACEDTRRTRKIFTHFGIASPRIIFSCHDHNEERSVARMERLLGEGLAVGLVSDAGMPGISDPGFLAVRMATQAGHEVEIIPGPSAVTAALAISGLPTASFTFLGFAPRKSGKRRRFLESVAGAEPSLVLFESPHRLGAMLADALGVLGDRRASVSIELTKMFEGTQRGWLSELAQRFADEVPRGEVTVVIAGNNAKFIREVDCFQGQG